MKPVNINSPELHQVAGSLMKLALNPDRLRGFLIALDSKHYGAVATIKKELAEYAKAM